MQIINSIIILIILVPCFYLMLIINRYKSTYKKISTIASILQMEKLNHREINAPKFLGILRINLGLLNPKFERYPLGNSAWT